MIAAAVGALIGELLARPSIKPFLDDAHSSLGFHSQIGRWFRSSVSTKP